MNVKDIEIPYEKDRGRRYRFFEILPGATSWSVLILPFVLSTFVPKVVIFFIIAYLLLWFVKSIGMDVRAIQGYKKMELYKKLSFQHGGDRDEGIFHAGKQVDADPPQRQRAQRHQPRDQHDREDRPPDAEISETHRPSSRR